MHVASACQDRLSELADVISQLSDNEYSVPLKALNNSSLGQHTRHVIEFFQCLLSQYSGGTINYDIRERNSSIEREVKTARLEIDLIRSQLESLVQDTTLVLQANFHQDEKNPAIIQTSLQRELVYQLEHTVHHMALLRSGISLACPHIQLPESFGVAASTIRYRMANE